MTFLAPALGARALAVLVVLVVALGARASGPPCEPRWSDEFPHGNLGGMGDAEVRALRVLDLGTGPALYAAGRFSTAGGLSSGGIAKWRACRGASCAADCDGDGAATGSDWGCFMRAYRAGDAAADCDGDGLVTLADVLCFREAFLAGCP